MKSRHESIVERDLDSYQMRVAHKRGQKQEEGKKRNWTKVDIFQLLLHVPCYPYDEHIICHFISIKWLKINWLTFSKHVAFGGSGEIFLLRTSGTREETRKIHRRLELNLIYFYPQLLIREETRGKQEITT